MLVGLRECEASSNPCIIEKEKKGKKKNGRYD